MLFIIILIFIKRLHFICLKQFFALLIKISLDLIIKFSLNFLKLISFAIIEIKSLIKKILLFIEFINEFELVSLLFHYLKLKSNCVVMLLRNLKFVRDLYNETRLQIKQIEFKTLNYRILKNDYNDKQHFISRILLVSFDSNNLYALFRRIQFLIRFIYNMIINKFQG